MFLTIAYFRAWQPLVDIFQGAVGGSATAVSAKMAVYK